MIFLLNEEIVEDALFRLKPGREMKDQVSTIVDVRFAHGVDD